MSTNANPTHTHPVSRWIDLLFFVLSLTLLVVALYQRYAAPEPKPHAFPFVLVTLGMSMMTGAPLVRRPWMRYTLLASALALFLASVLLR